MIKEHKEINELVDKFEQDLIKLFSDYGITNFEKTKGMILDNFCYQTTEAKPEAKLINEILSSLEWIRFKENGKHSKESHIECLGETLGLLNAFYSMFIYIVNSQRERL